VPKKKQERFDETATFPHVVQPSFDEIHHNFPLKGKWAGFFGNTHPIILELGCGKGEYTLALAKRYPHNNYLGVDIKGARIWRGAKTAFEDGMKNVAFLRTRIDFIEHAFAENEVDSIWITFPDPQPVKPRKRLTSPLFLSRYAGFLKPGGIIHLKTDNTELFEFTLEVINEGNHQLLMHTFDLHNSNLDDDVMLTQTHYEKLFLAEGKPIKYLRFQLEK
jgi:tRNA (guanine-N7-)-methyltransferase